MEAPLPPCPVGHPPVSNPETGGESCLIFLLKMDGRKGGREKHNEKNQPCITKDHVRAGELRQELTPAEGKLWACLRAHRFTDVHFPRQHAIGPYIVDFCAPSRKLIIEVDGSQHLDQEEYDSEHTVFLEAKGYHVLRVWNSDVMNKINDVMGIVLDELEKSRTGKDG